MKNLIIIFTALVALGSCNSSGNSKKQVPTGFENISWESEKMNEYQLIRPIEFTKGATDVYGLPLSSNEWYLVTFKTFYYLLPIEASNFVGLATELRIKKFAILDTIYPGFIKRGNPNIWGLSSVNKVEIVCFRSGYHIEPKLTLGKQITVSIEKK